MTWRATIVFVIVFATGCGPLPHTRANQVLANTCRRVELKPGFAARQLSEPLAIRSCEGDSCADVFVIPAGRRLLSNVTVGRDCQHSAAVVATASAPELAELWMIDLVSRTVSRSLDFGTADPTDGIPEWHGSRYFYGVYKPDHVHMSVFNPDGSRWLSVEGGHVWARPDGLFMMTTPGAKAPGHQDILLIDVENRRRTIVGPNMSGSIDLVTWEGTDATLWWRNSSSRRVALPTQQPCCAAGIYR